MTKRQAVHVMVRQTAISMAQELYELAAKDNAFYKRYPTRGAFLRLAWPQLIPQARATLATMLAKPLDENLKSQIHQALILDNSVRPV
jgi:hypothetical protein